MFPKKLKSNKATMYVLSREVIKDHFKSRGVTNLDELIEKMIAIELEGKEARIVISYS